MKFLHLADLHLGKRLNDFDLLADQRHMLTQALKLAADEAVDAVLLAGDLYDKRRSRCAAGLGPHQHGRGRAAGFCGKRQP